MNDKNHILGGDATENVVFDFSNDRSENILTFCNAKSIITMCTKGEHYEKNGTSKR